MNMTINVLSVMLNACLQPAWHPACCRQAGGQVKTIRKNLEFYRFASPKFQTIFTEGRLKEWF